MKKNIYITIAGIIGFLLFSTVLSAQEFSRSNPKINKILADTTFLIATEVTLQPGEKTDMHTHPAYFVYALSEGKMVVHYKDGRNETMELKPGMAMVSPPEPPHITENTGKTPVKFLIVELKDYPYKE